MILKAMNEFIERERQGRRKIMSAGSLRPIQLKRKERRKLESDGKSRSNRPTCGAPGRSFSGSSLAAATEIGIGVGTGIGRNEKEKTEGQAGAVQPKKMHALQQRAQQAVVNLQSA